MAYQIGTDNVTVSENTVPAFYLYTTESSIKESATTIASLFSRASNAVQIEDSAAHAHGTIHSNGSLEAISAQNLLGITYQLVFISNNQMYTGPHITISTQVPSSPNIGDILIQYTTVAAT